MSDWVDEQEENKNTAQQPEEAPQEYEGEEYSEEEYEYDDAQEQPEDEEYEDEEQEVYDDEDAQGQNYGTEDGAQNEGEDVVEPDESAYIMTLLDYLTDLISNPEGGSFISKPRVDAEACMKIINNIKQNIPTSIEYSYHTNRQKNRILSNAEQIADNKVQLALSKASKLKSDAEKV